MTEAPLVQLIAITKRFGEVLANDAVTFSAEAGEVHALLGENGAGKTTLMSILAGLYRPDSGEIRIAGRPVVFRSPRDAIQAGIGMVYQHFMLVDALTVAENVLIGARERGIWLDQRRIARALAEVSARYGLSVDPGVPVWQLSLGERQRVEIVRLLMYGARVLIFDEPTAVLTPQEADHLLRRLRELAASGLCVIFISHKLREVLSVADRITVLRRGRVVATLPAAEAEQRELARLMVGRDVSLPQRRGSRIGDTVLEVRDLWVRDDRDRLAVRGIDLVLRAGEIVGIAGVAGNGQRELAEALAGLRRVERGNVRIGGRELTHASPRQRLESGIAYVPEDRTGVGLCMQLTLWENAILRHYTRTRFRRGLLLNRSAARRFASELVETYQIVPPVVCARVGSLSGGNQQKLLLGRELAFRPRCIVALHPTRGVDVGATEQIYRALLAHRDAGAAVLLISEDLDELFALADRIGVLYEGQLVGMLPVEAADRERIGLLMAGIKAAPVETAQGEGEGHGVVATVDC